MKLMRRLLTSIIILATAVSLLILNRAPRSRPDQINSQRPSPAPTAATVPAVQVLSDHLEIPWALAFLPDGRILLTERPGRLRLIEARGELRSQPVATLNQVKPIGEGGLLGLAIHPNFLSNQLIYLYYTYSNTGSDTLNRVARFKFADDQLTDEKIIVDGIPGAANHNGGRIKFDPGGLLYITTGDAQEPSRAQDKNSLAGKILRVTDEGKPAPDNPFGSLIYSYGHRNPQGLAWDKENRLWAVEHGRSGVLSGLDELNLIEAGKNYGWPTIQGDESQVGLEKPKLHSGADTWAPSGLAYWENSLYFGGLRGQAFYEVPLTEEKLVLKEHFKKEFGRLRDAVLGPDNLLYVTTSNRDGRGLPQADDDKIIKIDPRQLSRQP